MPATYEPIATTTLGSAASSITFNSIPNTYTDLRLVLFSTYSTGSSFIKLQFNSDTGTNYSRTNLQGDGASATSNRQSSVAQINMGFLPASSGQTTLQTIDVFSYAGSSNKTCLIESSEDNNGSGTVRRIVGLWRNTAAITSITLTGDSTNFGTGTTATLYGILAAS